MGRTTQSCLDGGRVGRTLSPTRSPCAGALSARPQLSVASQRESGTSPHGNTGPSQLGIRETVRDRGRLGSVQRASKSRRGSQGLARADANLDGEEAALDSAVDSWSGGQGWPDRSCGPRKGRPLPGPQSRAGSGDQGQQVSMVLLVKCELESLHF